MLASQRSPEHYACQNQELQDLENSHPCEIQLLSGGDTTACKQTFIRITETVIKQLGETSQYIGLFPKQTVVKFSCDDQQESIELHGTHFFDIPIDCILSTKQTTIVNERTSFIKENPLFFPEIRMSYSTSKPINMDFQLEQLQLDELQQLKISILENDPKLFHDDISYVPSIWTIAIYIGVLTLICYILYRKCVVRKCIRTPKQPPSDETSHPEDVELQRNTRTAMKSAPNQAPRPEDIELLRFPRVRSGDGGVI